MANKEDLINRNGIWYFNRAFPRHLWPITGKTPFRRSLRTSSLAEARRAKPVVEQLYWSKVDEAQARIEPAKPRQLTELEAMGLVARWFKEEDAERQEALAEAQSPLTDIDAALEELDGQDALAREDVAEGNLYEVRQLAQRLAEEAGMEFDPKAKASKAFMRALLRGRRELLVLERARVLGDYSVQPTDPLIQTALRTYPDAPHVRTVGDLIDGYKADNLAKWSPATVKAVDAPLRLLSEFFGADRDVSTITRDDGRALFALVQGVPTNMTKLRVLRGLSVKEAVAKAAELGLPTLSPKTINETYLAFIGSAFRWGVSERWLLANPLQGLTVVDDEAAEDKRAPFTPAQLNRLFRSGPWEDPKAGREGDPLRYWGPLVALFQGMRRGEIAQLDVADVDTDGAIPAINVQPSKDGKRVKSSAGRRVLPIHPELIRLGFVAFAKRQAASGHKQLFPDEQPNLTGHWGDLLGKWFAGHLRATGIKGKRLGMHSFRHNFEDALRAAGLHGTPMGQELAGRAKADKVSGGYGEGRYSLETLKPAVESIRYPAVDLSHLYV